MEDNFLNNLGMENCNSVAPLPSEHEVNSSVHEVESEEPEEEVQCDDEPNMDLRPSVGQKFGTIDDAYQFYVQYSQDIGFDVRSFSIKYNKDREVTRKEFVCNKWGETKHKDGTPKKRRGAGRDGCKARMIVVKCKEGGYRVSIFDEAHLHVLLSSKRRFLLKSRRRITKVQKYLSGQLSMVNIAPHKQFDLFGVQAGGLENIGITQRDLYNFRRDEPMELKGHDGEMLHNHFLLEKERNASFAYAIDSDSEKRITRCFWSDAICRQLHGLYGEVVVFDITYNTNRYGMIFAPFVGVNNHGQTIVFSGAFLSDETIESFNWLFIEFLKVMPGSAPKMIITDQDAAMARAISETLPNTFHRLCSLHIMNKFSDKIDSIKYSEHKEAFKMCVWASETRVEFDYRWKEILDRSGLHSNKWLQSMFDLRFKWVPSYVNHIFSADMSSSQRAEGSHGYIKQYVGKNNSLLEFMIQYNMAIVRQRHTQLVHDHTDLNTKPRIMSPFKMERHIADLYTRKYFHMFQDELWASCNYLTNLVREDDNRRVREIVHDKVRDFATCSCQMWLSTGISYSHVLSYLLRVRQCSSLPEQYIIKRWCKSAKYDHVEGLDDSEIVTHKGVLERRTIFFQRFSNVVDKVILNDDASKIFCEGMESIMARVNSLLLNSSTSDVSSKGGAITCEASYNEPNPVAFKGCGKRLKTHKEKAIGKRGDNGRRCNGCGQTGVSHDKRNCPRLLNRSPPDEDNNSDGSDEEVGGCGE